MVKIVENHPGYNAWPMIVSSRGITLCVYCRGRHHDPGEPEQNVYCRRSSDGGESWEAEQCVSARSEYGESAVAKGIDENGDLLFMIRCFLPKTPYRHFELFRTSDGRKLEKIAVLKLEIPPMQITDVHPVPGAGLAALWFETGYCNERRDGSWGMIYSADNGRSWKQTVLGKKLLPCEVPQEQSMAVLSQGRLLMLSRLNEGGKQVLFTSTDNGGSWTRRLTNIDDMAANTPTLYLDRDSGQISCCYFLRGDGRLLYRSADAEKLFADPECWSAPEVIAVGSQSRLDTGNANVTACGKRLLVAYYSGKAPDTAIYVAAKPLKSC